MAAPVTQTVLNVRKGTSETVTINTDVQHIVDSNRAGNKGDEYRE